MDDPTRAVKLIEQIGAGCFGVIIGWYVYYINRYRKGDVQLSDIVTLIGILGGAAVQALYKPNTILFGAYSIGLCVGFFSYFFVLAVLVRRSPNFTADWFLDGRRKKPQPDEEIPDGTPNAPRAMATRPPGSATTHSGSD